MLAGGGSTIYGTFSLSRRTHADLPQPVGPSITAEKGLRHIS